ncbi:uncharacterized protein LOC111706229 [Eurytemora carolleeae]|uniref:uncharacterized protein LOC111706229 n=1 Tax=Eurytemora carolleeae TaxID=1294199 RepID=UPI000C75C859|nr:uncharacterized protein LOC111706229 [Eurytemora carolleeae]|eukprot:XP_023334817.1 uncharacterized protein LOC111706229 [Eurytemora affinis]
MSRVLNLEDLRPLIVSQFNRAEWMAKSFKMAAFRPTMDQNRAKIILGISPSTNIDDISDSDLHDNFRTKIDMGSSLTVDIRMIHEAYQFLMLKKRKLSGRTMTENWNKMGTKSKFLSAAKLKEQVEINEEK